MSPVGDLLAVVRNERDAELLKPESRNALRRLNAAIDNLE
jgi:hypothetical protein